MIEMLVIKSMAARGIKISYDKKYLKGYSRAKKGRVSLPEEKGLKS